MKRVTICQTPNQVQMVSLRVKPEVFTLGQQTPAHTLADSRKAFRMQPAGQGEQCLQSTCTGGMANVGTK